VKRDGEGERGRVWRGREREPAAAVGIGKEPGLRVSPFHASPAPPGGMRASLGRGEGESLGQAPEMVGRAAAPP